jgi:hypothetical protein
MTKKKKNSVEPDFMMLSSLSEEDAFIIHRASRILEQQSDFRRAAAEQIDTTAGYSSQLQNQNAPDRCNRPQGAYNQNWISGQSLAPSFCIPTAPGSRTSYDSQCSTGSGFASIPTSGQTVPNVPHSYNDYELGNFTGFDLQDSALGGISCAPLDMTATMPLNNGNLGMISEPYMPNMPGMEPWPIPQMPENIPNHQEHSGRFDTPLDVQMVSYGHSNEGSSGRSLHSASMSRHNSGSSEDHQNASDGSNDTIDSGRQHRKPFTPQERQETGNTRELVACIRCRQVIVPNPNFSNILKFVLLTLA